MKRVKLFPKTFFYVFSLMATIALISHALFYFIMPVVYTGQKEDTFKNIKTQLIEELKNVPHASQDEIESIVRKYAQQNQMGIFVNYAGQTYNFIVNTSFSDSSESTIQEEFESKWSLQVGEETDWDYFQQDFYRKTNSQLYSGIHFQTLDGQPCYLVMLLTLQPVNEAKSAVVIFLPFTLILSLVLSVIFALLYSKKITKPLSDISKTTERMKELDRLAVCKVGTQDEIGVLSENINELYKSLLTTIDDLQKENIRVSEAEAAKIDFLRAASHELKTPVTALCGMLDNMIMGIGRYKDWETYLPICQDMAVKFGVMIQEILDASKLNFNFESEPLEEVMLHTFLEKLIFPYLLIAKSKGVLIDTDFSDDFSAKFPVAAMEKVLSNIISNAVKYTNPQGTVRIYLTNKSIVVENECKPIHPNDLPHIFEPFYRPDFSRSRNIISENPNGGNGLGLYITAKILNALEYRFDFKPFLYPDDDKKSGMRFTIFF
ncbi:MAG: HAMP domain-containing histidine kinase [Lachnospiraceae bacterium]|nr:HAMP domain-containing histidine kinase [Lachnospiraceae bacterium]